MIPAIKSMDTPLEARVIGEGGMGKVLAFENLEIDGIPVAGKVMHSRCNDTKT